MSSSESSPSYPKKGSVGKFRGEVTTAEEQESLLGLSVTPPPPERRADKLRMGNQNEVCCYNMVSLNLVRFISSCHACS